MVEFKAEEKLPPGLVELGAAVPYGWYCSLCQKQCRHKYAYMYHLISDAHYERISICGQQMTEKTEKVAGLKR